MREATHRQRQRRLELTSRTELEKAVVDLEERVARAERIIAMVLLARHADLSLEDAEWASALVRRLRDAG